MVAGNVGIELHAFGQRRPHRSRQRRRGQVGVELQRHRAVDQRHVTGELSSDGVAGEVAVGDRQRLGRQRAGETRR